MGCGCSGEPIVLADDMRITSEWNGNARVYWSPSTTWEVGARVQAWLVQVLLLEAYGTSLSLDVLLQWSLDGVSWNGADAAILALAPTPATLGTREETYADDVKIMQARYVRFGLAVSASAGEGGVRLSATVTPIR